MAALQNQILKDQHPPGTAAACQASSAGKQGRGGSSHICDRSRDTVIEKNTEL